MLYKLTIRHSCRYISLITANTMQNTDSMAVANKHQHCSSSDDVTSLINLLVLSFHLHCRRSESKEQHDSSLQLFVFLPSSCIYHTEPQPTGPFTVIVATSSPWPSSSCAAQSTFENVRTQLLRFGRIATSLSKSYLVDIYKAETGRR